MVPRNSQQPTPRTIASPSINAETLSFPAPCTALSNLTRKNRCPQKHKRFFTVCSLSFTCLPDAFQAKRKCNLQELDHPWLLVAIRIGCLHLPSSSSAFSPVALLRPVWYLLEEFVCRFAAFPDGRAPSRLRRERCRTFCLSIMIKRFSPQ